MDIVFGLLSALNFGSADFIARFSTRTLGVNRTLLYMQSFGLFVLTLYLLLTGDLVHYTTQASWQIWFWGIVCSITYTLSYLCLYRAFALGQLAIVAPIASSYAAISVLLSVISGERLVPLQWLGIVAVLVGVVLAALQRSETPQEADQSRPATMSGRHLPAGVFWALLAAVGLGVTFWLLGFAVTPGMGVIVPVWLFRLVAVCVIAPMMWFRCESLAPPRGTAVGLVIGIGILDMGGIIFSTFGFAVGSIAIVSVLSSLYSAVSILLAWLFLHERLQKIQWSGIALLLTGIALTNL
ncbi:DMT family transporter [Dictyobacter formicarum]|uniref:Membrane protein n=1 Tax=Dictyobacter formicarum TaxID=2778368 RepID=A0ABQ3VSG8_9CHLR|nr:DMT family transporter [Dictyobacter formicarum]GHO88822.1 membrane protein [Dictyobacter formicarum]